MLKKVSMVLDYRQYVVLSDSLAEFVSHRVGYIADDGDAMLRARTEAYVRESYGMMESDPGFDGEVEAVMGRIKAVRAMRDDLAMQWHSSNESKEEDQ